MTVPKAERGMRFPYRLLWFIGYHLVLLWAVIDAANTPTRAPGFWFAVLGFLIGVALVLQAWSRLPAFYHGISLLVLIPGFALVGPLLLNSAYRAAVMSPQNVTVVSASSHEVSSIVANVYTSHQYSYTDVRVRLSGGSVKNGIIRPSQDVPTGSSLRMQIDPTGLVRPQLDNGEDLPGWAAALILLVAVLAEIELVSALLRPDGSSFIAETARSNKDSAST